MPVIQNAKRIGWFKSLQNAATLTPKGVIENMKATLHPYQEYSKNFILDHPFCALLLDMGL